MYDNILYPADGSDGAEAALDTVRDLAETYDATVHVLFVAQFNEIHGLSSEVEVTESGGMIGDPEGDKAGMIGDRTKDSELRERAQQTGTEIVQTVAGGLGDVETRTEVQWGTPYETILDYADTHGMDLIVMGTHGRTGLDRYLLGSVTEKVVRLSDVPVLTVRKNADT